MHVVHYSDRFQKLDDAIDKPDGLMVLGFFFEVYFVIFVNLPVFSIYKCMHFFYFIFIQCVAWSTHWDYFVPRLALSHLIV